MTTTRKCVFCGDLVTSTNATVNYCRDCYYNGTALNAQFGKLIAELDADAYWWHTGGGCFALRIDTADGYLLATDCDGFTPDEDEDGPWLVGHYVLADDGVELLNDDEDCIIGDRLDRAALIALVNRVTCEHEDLDYGSYTTPVTCSYCHVEMEYTGDGTSENGGASREYYVAVTR